LFRCHLGTSIEVTVPEYKCNTVSRTNVSKQCSQQKGLLNLNSMFVITEEQMFKALGSYAHTHTHAHSCMHTYMHYTHRFQEGVRFLSVHKAWVGQFLVKSDMLNSGLHFPNTLDCIETK